MSLSEKIQEEVTRQLEEGKKDKKKRVRSFKIPGKGKVTPVKAKKGYVCVMKVNENGHLDFTKHRIVDQTILEDEIPRLAASKYVMFYKKMPVIFLPSWSVEPYSPYENYESSLTDGSNTAGYRLLLSRMKTELVKAKKKIGGLGMTIFGLVIGGVILYALITGGGA